MDIEISNLIDEMKLELLQVKKEILGELNKKEIDEWRYAKLNGQEALLEKYIKKLGEINKKDDEKIYYRCLKTLEMDILQDNGEADIRFIRGKKYEMLNFGPGRLVLINEKGTKHSMTNDHDGWFQYFERV